MKKTLVGAAICAALIFGSSGAAFAGEVNGNGDATPAGQKAHSACVYSGLEDGTEYEGQPAGPGYVQNWGHTKDGPGVVSLRGAAEVELTFDGFTFTAGCNPHVGGE